MRPNKGEGSTKAKNGKNLPNISKFGKKDKMLRELEENFYLGADGKYHRVRVHTYENNRTCQGCGAKLQAPQRKRCPKCRQKKQDEYFFNWLEKKGVSQL